MLFNHDGCDYYWDVYVRGYSFWPTYLGFLKLGHFGSATTHFRGCLCPWTLPLNIGSDIGLAQTGPLSEPMIVRLPTHTCVTRPQWVKQWRKLLSETLVAANMLPECMNSPAYGYRNIESTLPELLRNFNCCYPTPWVTDRFTESSWKQSMAWLVIYRRLKCLTVILCMLFDGLKTGGLNDIEVVRKINSTTVYVGANNIHLPSVF